MYSKAVFLVNILASTLVGAMPSELNGNLAPSRGWCGSNSPPAHVIEAAKQMQEMERANRESGIEAAAAAITVPVYFHVAASKANANQLSNATLTKQFNVLRDSYSPYGVNFVYKGSDLTVDDNIATGLLDDNGGRTSAQQKAFDTYVKKVRKGTYSTLNVYFYTNFPSGLLGLCYFPESTSSGSATFYRDGCQINSGSVPGGPLSGFNLGKTAVHEVGHWLGLFHVFQGQSCSGSGDYVSDTPLQSSATSGCPTGKDSCPNSAGADAIHNYMDYSSDECYTGFTAGQQSRINSQWSAYRANK